MEGHRGKPSGGLVSLHGELPISTASWFYMGVIMFFFLGLSICFSCKKIRHRLLGLEEQANESGRDSGSEKSRSSDGPGEDGEPEPSSCSTDGVRPTHRRACVDKNSDVTEFEMTELPPVPANPPSTPESVFLD